jgi:hypothetical protein
MQKFPRLHTFADASTLLMIVAVSVAAGWLLAHSG